MRDFILIAIGAALGANARYLVAGWLTRHFGPEFPWGTFVVNISGGVAIGFILTLLAQRLVADPSYRLLLVTGFLGAYTTFSSFTYETLWLIEEADYLRAGLNVVGSVAIGLLATVAGVILARLLG